MVKQTDEFVTWVFFAFKFLQNSFVILECDDWFCWLPQRNETAQPGHWKMDEKSQKWCWTLLR